MTRRRRAGIEQPFERGVKGRWTNAEVLSDRLALWTPSGEQPPALFEVEDRPIAP